VKRRRRSGSMEAVDPIELPHDSNSLTFRLRESGFALPVRQTRQVQAPRLRQRLATNLERSCKTQCESAVGRTSLHRWSWELAKKAKGRSTSPVLGRESESITPRKLISVRSGGYTRNATSSSCHVMYSLTDAGQCL